jgi:uncharacterized protein YcfJ
MQRRISKQKIAKLGNSAKRPSRVCRNVFLEIGMTISNLAVAALLIATIVGGCANSGSNYRPLVDLQGRSDSQFQSDLNQCQGYASQVMNAGEKAAIGAVAGALIGSAISSLFGGDRHSRNDASMYGALVGAGSGGASAEDEQRTIIRRCLSGRGYNVLN